MAIVNSLLNSTGVQDLAIPHGPVTGDLNYNRRRRIYPYHTKQKGNTRNNFFHMHQSIDTSPDTWPVFLMQSTNYYNSLFTINSPFIQLFWQKKFRERLRN